MIVELTGELVLFIAEKLGVLPLPEAANPILVIEFVHVNVPPAGVVEYADAGTVAPLQTVMFATGFITELPPPPPPDAGCMQSNNAILEPAPQPLCVMVYCVAPPGTLMVTILPDAGELLYAIPEPPLIAT